MSAANKRYILLSFDIEEFDVPLEHGVDLPMSEQVRISTEGAHALLDVLKQRQVVATFFTTAHYAEQAPEIVQRILDEGHELASHGYYHSHFEVADLRRSKERLEELSGREVTGYRMARMMPVPEEEVARAGYSYNSSLNPTFIPGRYMHLKAKRTPHRVSSVLQIPASVTPCLRFPLFWLCCHNLPFSVYLWLCKRTLKHDGHLVTYFHPWEFYDLSKHPELNLPFIIRNNSGEGMLQRLDRWIAAFQDEGALFVHYADFASTLTL